MAHPLGSIAARVAYLHELSGLDRTALSTAAGLAPAHVGMLIRGTVEDPASSSVKKLADATGTTTDWIIGGKGRRPTRATVRAALAEIGASPLTPTGTDAR